MSSETLTKLTRARDILVKLRDEATPGPWVTASNSPRKVWQAPPDTWNDYPIIPDVKDEDANLIVTLHAALPTLIQVLDAGIWQARTRVSGKPDDAVLALAEAVIGAAG